MKIQPVYFAKQKFYQVSERTGNIFSLNILEKTRPQAIRKAFKELQRNDF